MYWSILFLCILWLSFLFTYIYSDVGWIRISGSYWVVLELQLLSEEVFDFSRGELPQSKIKELKNSLNRYVFLLSRARTTRCFCSCIWRACLIWLQGSVCTSWKKRRPSISMCDCFESLQDFALMFRIWICGIVNREFQLYELCQYVLSISQRPELIRATLSTLHAFLSWIPLSYIFESALVSYWIFVTENNVWP